MENWRTESVEALFQAILKLKTAEECAAFFEDLCTIKELREMAQRLSVAQMLANGQIYANIAKETGASTATISRVNRCLSYGNGGYEMILSRLKEQ